LSFSEDIEVVVLRTNNLSLSRCTLSDRTDFIDLERDPEVMHFLNGGAVDHETTDPRNVTFLMPRGTEPDVWTARRADGGAFVGWFCLSSEGNGVGEIGYRLRRDAWGKGFASEGALSLVNWGFQTAGFEKIVACTMAMNIGSRRVMEKIGMKYVRTVPFDAAHFPGSEQGEVWYELTRSEWAAS
jgi:RimJ/RimL family protein N-acetyltransferase